MKNLHRILPGLLVLALVSLAGTGAADETGTTTAAVTGTVGADDAANDDILPYEGPIGPGNPLYGLKLAFENLDEAFTFSETERFNKQLNNAKVRLSEARRELMLNNTGTAEEALGRYWQKLNLTQARLFAFNASNASGLLHAQEMIGKHRMVLERLMLSHPGVPGLARAYNNSLRLEERFENRTMVRFERVMEKNNRTVLRAVRFQERGEERTSSEGQDRNNRVQQQEDMQGGADGNGQGRKAGAAADTTTDQGRAGGGGADNQGRNGKDPAGQQGGNPQQGNGKGRNP